MLNIPHGYTDLFDMANIKSQKKRILRSERERLENLRYTSAVKTHFQHLRDAVDAGDSERAQAEHRKLNSKVDKAAKTGAIHKRNAARKKSRAAKLLAGKS